MSLPEMTTTTDVPPTLSLNLAAAERFVETIAGSAETSCTWQLLKPGADSFLFHGTLAECRERLLQANRSGYNIYFTVNETDLRGRKAENITRVRAFFVDDDDNQVTDEIVACLPPSMKVLTKRGPHFYWLVSDAKLDDFTAVQTQLARHFKTDTTIKDLPRVMRVPGFIRHPKGHEGGTVVELVYAYPERRYTVEEVVGAFPSAQAGEERARAGGSKGSLAHRNPLPAAKREKPSAEWILEEARQFLRHSDPAVQGEEGDKATYCLAAELTRGFGLSCDEAFELLLEWNLRCAPPWSREDLRKKVENAATYGTGEVGERLRMLRRDDIAYVVSHARYYVRRGEEWDVCAPIGQREAVVAYLTKLGVGAEKARALLGRYAVVVVDALECMPEAGPIVEAGERRILNSWVPPRLHPKAGTWPTIQRIVEFVTDWNGTAEFWLLNWMAFVVQYPGRQPGPAVVLVGEQGIGKSILAGLLRKMVGEENSCTIGQRDLESDFNGHYAGKLLVIGEEVATSENRRHVAGHLKQCIGHPTVTVNIKGLQHYEIPNRAAYWFNTNSTRPVDFEDGERHYSLICSRVSGVERNPELRALFEGCFEGGSFTPGFQEEIQAFFYDLKNLKVDVNLAHRVLLSDDRDVLIDASRPSATAFIAELQDRGVDYVVRSYSTRVADERKAAEGVPTNVLYEAYVSWCKANGFQFPVSKAHLGAELHRQGVDNRRRGTGCRPHCYVFPESWRTPAATVPEASIQGNFTAVGQQSPSVAGSAAQAAVGMPPSTPSVSDVAPKSDEEKEREWLELIGETPAQEAVA